MSVWLFQRFDLLQVCSDGDEQRRLLDSFAGRFKLGDTQFWPSSSWRLRRCASSACAAVMPALTTTRTAHVPLDMITAVGDSVPVVVAFGIPGDGKHLRSPVNLDVFDGVDSRHKLAT
jgi:hypothetical protein